jgi:hypothetical protein
MRATDDLAVGRSIVRAEKFQKWEPETSMVEPAPCDMDCGDGIMQVGNSTNTALIIKNTNGRGMLARAPLTERHARWTASGTV